MTAKTDEAIANTNVFIKTCTNVESVSTSLKFDRPTNFIGDNKSQSTKLKLKEKITGITINIRVPRTAGSINILFTDKTGTLTEGKLKVENFIDAELNSHKKINNLKDEVYETVYQSLVYNNESFYSDGVVQGGNTTDRAILEYCGSDNKNKYKYKIISKELFNSKLKYSKVITNYNGKTEFIKGAYEVILDKCTYYMKSNGEKRVLIDKNKILNYINNITNNGNRVLGLAINDGIRYILIGFVTLKDTIRKEAFSAIESIKSAGVLVVMVTGDAKETACRFSVCWAAAWAFRLLRRRKRRFVA